MWDPAHNLQSSWSKVVKPGKNQDKLVKKVLEVYESPMKDFNTGKIWQVFRDVGEDAGFLILTNKTYQSTRFVRALLRCLETALRNLPTFVLMYEEMQNDALEDDDNTTAKKFEKLMKGLTDPVNLVSALGLIQLLEI